MEFLHSSLEVFVYFGAGISFLYAFLEIVKKTPANKTLATILFFTGTILLRYGWYYHPSLLSIPYLFTFLLTSVMLVGPMVFVYIRSRLENISEGMEGPKELIRKYWIHFIPALFFGISEILYFTQDSEQIKELVRKSSQEFRYDWIHAATFLASVQVSVYSLLCLHIYHRISRKYEIYELKLVWIILLLPVVANTLIGPAYFLKNILLFQIGAACISLIVLLLFVLKERHPGFFSEMTAVIQNAKYQNTTLAPEDIEQANAKLKNILEQQKFYRDSELRLIDLAAGLGLSVHQTSRYLNEVQKMSFYELVNRYRVQEACKLLLSERNQSVLDIGFEVGFNSKSAFNSQFVKATGMSPALYRKNHLQSSD